MESIKSKYAFWDMNLDAYNKNKVFENKCSACGGILNDTPDTCPYCNAVMVEPTGVRDVNGRVICQGDIVQFIKGDYSVLGIVGRYDDNYCIKYYSQRHDNIRYAYFYDFDHFRVVKSIVPEGETICGCEFTKAKELGQLIELMECSGIFTEKEIERWRDELEGLKELNNPGHINNSYRKMM